MMTDLELDDAKLVRLARSARARTGAPQGAAVRDANGRTYAAATVTLPSLQVDALDLAIAMALSSAATALEAAAVVGPRDHVLRLEALRDFAGAGLPVLVAGVDGAVTGVRHT